MYPKPYFIYLRGTIYGLGFRVQGFGSGFIGTEFRDKGLKFGGKGRG